MTDNKAVMQQALRAFNLYLDWDGKDSSMLATFDIAANIVRDKLIAAIAQPEQTNPGPVAWRVRRLDAPNYWIIFLHYPVDAMSDPEREVQPLYIAQSKDKPADDFDKWAKNPYTLVLQKSLAEDYVPRFAQPAPVRQPLTRKQLIDMLVDVIDSDDKTFIKFARAVESAHGITQTKDKQ